MPFVLVYLFCFWIASKRKIDEGDDLTHVQNAKERSIDGRLMVDDCSISVYES